MVPGFSGLRAVLVLLLMAISACASSQSRPWEGLFTNGEPHFTAHDREAVRNFYRGHEYPPALAAPETLAPDLATRIERSAPLPPDLGEPLPMQLEQQLSELPPGHVRFRVGDDVVLMDTRTREVLDVIRDILP